VKGKDHLEDLKNNVSVCPSIRPREKIGSHWTDFHENWYLKILRKTIEKMQFFF